MLPSSDELEAFHDRLQAVDAQLAKLKAAEVTDTGLIEQLADASKSWLRISAGLTAEGAFDAKVLAEVDGVMQAILASTRTRARASAYRSKLEPVLDRFTERILVPLIRIEGSPTHVAARQIESVFEGLVAPEEREYIDEAARCMTARCYRATIIMLWAAAIARLHRAVEQVGFDRFNQAVAQVSARKRNPYNRFKGSAIKSLPELQRGRDSDLLIVGMELWGYDLQVFEELERLLGTRNSAAHPGMLRPTALDVQQFATKLAALVFTRIGRAES